MYSVNKLAVYNQYKGKEKCVMALSKKCVALYDYTGRDGEELTVKKNEKLTVVDNQGTWWKVRNEYGKDGLVPSNYVQVSATNNSRSDIKDGPGMYQQTDLIPAKQSLNILAVAKYNYQASPGSQDELDLKKGEEIIVMEKEADGWWRGRCGAKIGWFPFNYVEEKADSPAPSSSGATAAPPATDKPKEKVFICGVIALYSFNSGNPEELQFEKGDLMDIVDQPSDDPDWWEARKSDGAIGLVPRNYVEVVHDAEPVFGKTPPTIAAGGPPAPGGQVGGPHPPPPFAHEPWFYGKLARRQAENILNTQAQNGQFIVRESETKVISIVHSVVTTLVSQWGLCVCGS